MCARVTLPRTPIVRPVYCAKLALCAQNAQLHRKSCIAHTHANVCELRTQQRNIAPSAPRTAARGFPVRAMCVLRVRVSSALNLRTENPASSATLRHCGAEFRAVLQNFHCTGPHVTIAGRSVRSISRATESTKTFTC